MLHPPELDSASRPLARDAAALFLLALGVNLIRLGSKSIAHDEAGSVHFAGLSLSALGTMVTRSDPNMSLYYFLLNAWVRLFGESEAAVRFPSALFGALAVPVVYCLGCRLFGRAAGGVAALLLALNAFMVEYAQTARAYSLLVLLTTLSSLFFVREIERPSNRNRLGYVIASALAVYAHYFAVWVLAAQWATLLAMGLPMSWSAALLRRQGWMGRERRAEARRSKSTRKTALPRQWLGVIASIILLSAPAAFVAARAGAVNRINWIPPPSLLDIGRVCLYLAAHSWVLLCALFASGCYATARGVRQGRLWPHAFAAAWWLVPIALCFAVSLVKPMFLSYYLLLCLPGFVLFGAAGIGAIRPAAAAYAVVALLALTSATRLVDYYRREAQQDWRTATRYVLSSIRADDGVIYFPDSAAKPFGYYARQSGKAKPADLAGQSLVGKQRIWFVIRASDFATMRARFLQLQAGLQESFHLAEHRAFGLAEIELYVR